MNFYLISCLDLIHIGIFLHFPPLFVSCFYICKKVFFLTPFFYNKQIFSFFLHPISLHFCFLIIWQDEYAKAYYAALLKQQQELEAATKLQELGTTSDRQVGIKSKRDDDVEEEKAPAAGQYQSFPCLHHIALCRG